jgi:hypothetical protein
MSESKIIKDFLNKNLQMLTSIGLLATSNICPGHGQHCLSNTNLGFNIVSLAPTLVLKFQPDFTNKIFTFDNNYYNDLAKIGASFIIGTSLSLITADHSITKINNALTSLLLTAIWSDTGQELVNKLCNDYMEYSSEL